MSHKYIYISLYIYYTYIYIHISQQPPQAGLPVSLSTEMMRTFNSCPSCTRDVVGGQQKSDKTWDMQKSAKNFLSFVSFSFMIILHPHPRCVIEKIVSSTSAAGSPTRPSCILGGWPKGWGQCSESAEPHMDTQSYLCQTVLSFKTPSTMLRCSTCSSLDLVCLNVCRSQEARCGSRHTWTPPSVKKSSSPTLSVSSMTLLVRELSNRCKEWYLWLLKRIHPHTKHTTSLLHQRSCFDPPLVFPRPSSQRCGQGPQPAGRDWASQL